MHDSDSNGRQLLLLKTRAELQTRLTRIRVDRHHGETPLEANFSDQAVQRENDEVLDSLERSAEWELIQIERALARISIGQGNDCSVCGRPIEKARVSALPSATECAICANKLSDSKIPISM